MSDLMLLGVLRMPTDCWDGGPMDVMQRHDRYLQAAELIEKLRAVQDAAEQLLSLVENKGQPQSHPDNQRLINTGDTISVNEGNLWLLQAALNEVQR